MHVRVQSSAGEAKFWMEPGIELAQNYGLNTRQLNNAKRLVQEHEDEIRERGKPTSAVEVANVSPHGFWLMIDRTEYFLPFEHFPWFRDATIGELTNVQLPSPAPPLLARLGRRSRHRIVNAPRKIPANQFRAAAQ